MIGYLNGKILDRSDGKLLVGFGGAEGTVGYSVNVPHNSSYELLPMGQMLELFIYTHVREDALELFGFLSRAEKDLFLTLLSVNGIGPKGAMSILAGASADDLIRAIVEGDKAFLTRMPGIGKKTAERVVLELADTMRKKLQAGVFKSPAQHPAGASAHESPGGRAPRSSSAFVDALEALVGLGYRESEVSEVLKRMMTDSPGKPAEEMIKTALRQLN